MRARSRRRPRRPASSCASRGWPPTTASGCCGRSTPSPPTPRCDAIICLTPLPESLTLAEAGERIAPAKDVDGASPASLGRLAAGLPAFAPATAQAVIELLHHSGTRLEGADAVVVGRSIVVGKPLAMLLLAENATVTVCHTRTVELEEKTAGPASSSPPPGGRI